eukprot:COSAG02_NODE_10454_length_1937_cov_20.744831_1_plen_51_part_10
MHSRIASHRRSRGGLPVSCGLGRLVRPCDASLAIGVQPQGAVVMSRGSRIQ